MSQGLTAQGLRAEEGRAGLIALGRAGRAWEYVPAALRWLTMEGNAGDSDVRVLLAASYGRLGLRTAGEEVMAGLPAHAARSAAGLAVRAMLAGLGDDRVGREALAARARGNAAALGEWSEAGARAAVEGAVRWWEGECGGAIEVFRAGDGNFVARRPGREWVRWGDAKSAAREGLKCVTERKAGAAGAAPVYVEGLSNAWVARGLVETAPRGPDGSWAAVVMVEEDEAALAWGLGTVDVAALLSQERTTLFAGAGAKERCERWLMERLEFALAGDVVDGGGAGALAGVLERVLGAQAAELEAAKARIAQPDAPGAANGAGAWKSRYATALAGKGERLRVLIPTSRFTTFLRHSAHDLAAALRRAGCEVQVLEEPADHWRLAALAEAKLVARWRPDMMVGINWPRTARGPGARAAVPYVMFVQDAMPHLFTAETGRSLGALDYVMGHLYGQWFLDFGYPRARTLQCPVLVNGEKFHAGPVEAALLREHACEVAYASHQSETPEACRDRLIRETRASGGAMAGVVEELWPRVVRMTEAALTEWDHPAMLAEARGAIEKVTGREAEPSAVMLTVNSVIKVLGDRLLRHRTLGWAARVCEKRGWRLRVYGRGWEKHPELGRYACGELEHGEALRASYQGAAVHLHASSGWMLHQRVMECAMSGGLPLVRLKREDVQALVGYTEAAVGERAARRAEESPGLVEGSWAEIAVHPEAMALAAQMQRVGLQAPVRVYVEREIPSKPWLAWEGQGASARGMPYEAAWLLGDWSETTFTTEAHLERLVEKAVERSEWRGELSKGIAGRARRRFTYDAMAERLLAFMAETLP